MEMVEERIYDIIKQNRMTGRDQVREELMKRNLVLQSIEFHTDNTHTKPFKFKLSNSIVSLKQSLKQRLSKFCEPKLVEELWRYIYVFDVTEIYNTTVFWVKGEHTLSFETPRHNLSNIHFICKDLSNNSIIDMPLDKLYYLSILNEKPSYLKTRALNAILTNRFNQDGLVLKAYKDYNEILIFRNFFSISINTSRNDMFAVYMDWDRKDLLNVL